jgi:hypothetical protein
MFCGVDAGVLRDWHGLGAIGTLVGCGSVIPAHLGAPATETILWQSLCFVASVPRL